MIESGSGDGIDDDDGFSSQIYWFYKITIPLSSSQFCLEIKHNKYLFFITT